MTITPTFVNVDYVPDDFDGGGGAGTGNAHQKLNVFCHTGTLVGMNSYRYTRPRPCLVHVIDSGWTVTSLRTSYTATRTGIDDRICYEMLKRGWVVASVRLTQAGLAVTGGGSGHPPGTAQYQDLTRAMWNKDILFAVMHLRRYAASYNIDPDRMYGIGGSAGGVAIATAGLREWVPGELGVSGDSADYGYSWNLQGIIVPNMPARLMQFVETSAIGGAAGSIADPDTPGTTLADIPVAHRRAFSPYYFSNRVIPVLAAYSDTVSVSTRFEEPFQDNVEASGGNVHPVVSAEVLARAWNHPNPVRVGTGTFPRFIGQAFSATGFENPVTTTGLVSKIVDTASSLNSPMLRFYVDWLTDLDALLAPEDAWREETRTIFTSAVATTWVLASADNAAREGDVQIAAYKAYGDPVPFTVAVDNVAGYAAGTTSIDVDNDADGLPDPLVRAGATLTFADGSTAAVVAVSNSATEQTLTITSDYTETLTDDEDIYVTNPPAPPEYVEVLATRRSFPEPIDGATQIVFVDNVAGYSAGVTTIEIDDSAGAPPSPRVAVGQRLVFAGGNSAYVTAVADVGSAPVTGQSITFTAFQPSPALSNNDPITVLDNTSGERLLVNPTNALIDVSDRQARVFRNHKGALWVRSLEGEVTTVVVSD